MNNLTMASSSSTVSDTLQHLFLNSFLEFRNGSTLVWVDWRRYPLRLGETSGFSWVIYLHKILLPILGAVGTDFATLHLESPEAYLRLGFV